MGEGGHHDRDPPWTGTPLDRESPGQRPPGQSPPGPRLPLDRDRPPTLWTESQTGVKNYLPATSFAGGNNWQNTDSYQKMEAFQNSLGRCLHSVTSGEAMIESLCVDRVSDCAGVYFFQTQEPGFISFRHKRIGSICFQNKNLFCGKPVYTTRESAIF